MHLTTSTPVNMSQSIYHPTKEKQWTGINWSKVELTIENLQHRITKATERGEHRKVRDLQRLLTRSLSARLKAVRIVAQENSGKKSPGLDGEIWTTPNLKIQAALELRKKSPIKPLKPMDIPKANGKQRPLGIPCMGDRARQAVWNLALLPCVEATSDPHSYGFRPYRGCWDANAQIRNLFDKRTSTKWILNAAIQKSFDKINHHWLLKNTPMETKVLKSWLKAGYIENSELFPTEKGTSQGGVISPTLANLTLNGLEKFIKEKFKPGYAILTNGNKSRRATCLNVVRYADNFIVTGQSKRQLNRVKLAIHEFLQERGLRLNDEKTSIRSITKGFDFLGWTFRCYPVFLAKISKTNIIRHRREIKYLIKTTHTGEALIQKLNTKIRDWMNYHHCCNGIWDVWSAMNHYLYGRLMKWGQRRHGNKTKKWIFQRYWKRLDGRWTFTVTPDFRKGEKEKTYTLMHYNLKQKRIGRRISQDTNVFDLKNKEKIRQVQLAKTNHFTFQKFQIWKRQKGLCPGCKTLLDPNQSNNFDLHH